MHIIVTICSWTSKSFRDRIALMHDVIVPLFSLYVALSLVFPLKISWWLRVLLAIPIILGGIRSLILDEFWPGKTFFLPEAPRLVLMLGSALFVFLIIALCLTVLRDIIALITWSISKLRQGKAKSSHRPNQGFPFRKLGAAVYIISTALTCLSAWESMRVPDVKPITITLDNLAPQYKGFKIAVLADLHIAQLNDRAYADEIVKRTNALDADIIVLPGDVIDGDVSLRRDAVAPLAGLKARYGVYVTAGNHEYYSGYHAWMDEFRRLGMIPLENANTQPLPGLYLAGVGDIAGLQSSREANIKRGSVDAPAVDFAKAIQGVDGPVIMLAHRPDLAPLGAQCGVDLQIAGHTHGGMMIGFDRIIARYNGGYVSGLYENINNTKTQLYVSNGAGLWPGFIMRVGVLGEITLITLQ